MQDEAQKYLKDLVETGRATLRVVSIYAEMCGISVIFKEKP